MHLEGASDTECLAYVRVHDEVDQNHRWNHEISQKSPYSGSRFCDSKYTRQQANGCDEYCRPECPALKSIQPPHKEELHHPQHHVIDAESRSHSGTLEREDKAIEQGGHKSQRSETKLENAQE